MVRLYYRSNLRESHYIEMWLENLRFFLRRKSSFPCTFSQKKKKIRSRYRRCEQLMYHTYHKLRYEFVWISTTDSFIWSIVVPSATKYRHDVLNSTVRPRRTRLIVETLSLRKQFLREGKDIFTKHTSRIGSYVFVK